MPLPVSGSISLAQVQTEFATSGQISMSQLYSTNYATPSFIGRAFSSNNGTGSGTLNLPNDAISSDKVYVLIQYDNSTTNRPSITGLTIDASFNGTYNAVLPGDPASSAIFTAVLLSGEVGNTGYSITIPNDSTYGGYVATAVVVRNAQSYTSSLTYNNSNTFVNPSIGRSQRSHIASVAKGELAIYLGAHDGSTETFTSWTGDSNFTSTYSYLSNSGAVSGRAAFIGLVEGNNYSEISTTSPDSATNATTWAKLHIKGVKTGNTVIAGLPSKYSVPSSGQIKLSDFYGVNAVRVIPLQTINFANYAASGSNIILNISAYNNYKDRWLYIAHGAATGATNMNPSISITTNTVSNTSIISTDSNINLGYYNTLTTDSDGHHVSFVGAKIKENADSVALSWSKPEGIFEKGDAAAVYLLTSIPSITNIQAAQNVAGLTTASITLLSTNNSLALLVSVPNQPNSTISLSNASSSNTSVFGSVNFWHNSSMSSNTVFSSANVGGTGYGLLAGIAIEY